MNLFFWGTVINLSAVLMCASVGETFALKSGNFNLGGEGQIYAGGFIAAIFILKFQNFCSPIIILFCIFVSGFCSGLLSFFSGLLKKFKNADTLLTSYLFSAAIIPIIDSLIAGKFRGQTNNLLATDFIPPQFRFLQINSISTFIFIPIIFCIGFYFFITKTSFGKKICVYGISADFALYSGFSEDAINLVSLFVSGFFHGLAGMFAVTGIYFTCHQGFYLSLGWNALSISLLAFSNPLLIIPASFLISLLATGANQIALFHNFGFDMGNFLQGIFLFLIVAFSSQFKQEKFWGRGI